ncbi:PREDICTED: serine/threonine-protein kinase MARK2-like isoform X2 [Ipomoea nil]|uniref:serine/threonine-protein kinase MARK2-like isoform X2 n=1 Tax=Ipomoea nil TaxID=35883 RepID=UPI0009018488|nr:PREDICTED: serine/threonine-protein kinase MARK2-like isoform X2 [Ipomoea nil]
MDQFQQIGEVVGSLKALMVLQHEISINQRQCCLLYDILVQAFDTIAEEIRQNLRLDERNTKWKVLERPMGELHRIFKECESYIKYCLDIQDWWGKAVALQFNTDCVEFHIHNLLCCFPVVIEAIETAAEVSGQDEEEMQKRRVALMNKYGADWNDPRLFLWKYGKQYLVPREICSRLERAWKEDRWLLLESIKEKKNTKLGEGLMKMMLDGSETTTMNTKLLHTSVLLRANGYAVKRRLGSGSRLKEINWLGESFAMRSFYGDAEEHTAEISMLLSLSHPNVLQYYCGFHDEVKKEGFLVMELMSKSLDASIKENSGQKKRMSFSIPVAVDIMLQIARGMEYLHSRKIHHGELNPSNILLKPRYSSAESYFQAKVAGFGLSSVKRNYTYKSSPKPGSSAVDAVIWCAPEVLAEQEQPGSKCAAAKYSEKADVYSFGMVCFHLLTGKVPFEDGERQIEGGKIFRNLIAGQRPLFPHPSPRYLVNLTKKCWQTDPSLRPRFSSICRILRYIKKVLVINPEHGQPECPPPLVDYCDIEARYSKKLPEDGICTVSQIPYQMFAYKLVEREKASGSSKEKSWEPPMDDLFRRPADSRSAFSDIIDRKDMGTCVDQRSVISDDTQRKSPADPRSLVAINPERKFLPGVSPIEKLSFAETPEWKQSNLQLPRDEMPGRKLNPSSGESKKLNGDCMNSADEQKPKESASDQKPASPQSPGQRPSPGEQTPCGLEAPQNKHSAVVMANYKIARSESTQRRTLSNSVKLTKIPEKKSLSSSEIGQSSSASQPSNPRSPSNKKFKDTRASNESGKLKDRSPSSSPARIKRTHSSPVFSGSGITRTQSVPVSLTIQPLKTSSPSRGPPVNTSGYVSQGLLTHPHSNKINRAGILQSVMSLKGHRKAQVKDTEIS